MSDVAGYKCIHFITVDVVAESYIQAIEKAKVYGEQFYRTGLPHSKVHAMIPEDSHVTFDMAGDRAYNFEVRVTVSLYAWKGPFNDPAKSQA